MDILNMGWKKPDDDPNFAIWIAADFDHEKGGDPFGGFFRVEHADLNILVSYWKEPDANVPPDCQNCP